MGKIWPTEKYTLSTRLSEEEIAKRIRENIALNPTLWYTRLEGNSDKPYEGWIQGREFKITRIGEYGGRNRTRASFAIPIVTGHIIPFEGYTWIEIDMRPESPGLLSYGIRLFITSALIGFFLILAVWEWIKPRVGSPPMGVSEIITILLFLFVLGPWWMSRQYKPEREKAKKFLSTLLEGDMA